MPFKQLGPGVWIDLTLTQVGLQGWGGGGFWFILGGGGRRDVGF